MWELSRLRFQQEWNGPDMITLPWRVCPTCYDVPTNNKRTIFIQPDPMPVSNPRPADYSVADVPAGGYTDTALDLLFPVPE